MDIVTGSGLWLELVLLHLLFNSYQAIDIIKIRNMSTRIKFVGTSFVVEIKIWSDI